MKLPAIRIFAKDYSPEEIRAMQAGPLIDWLAWQATLTVQETESKWFVFNSLIHGNALMVWQREKHIPKTFTDCSKISSDYGAGMRAMIEIAPLLKHNVSTFLFLSSSDSGNEWDLHLDDGRYREYESEECPTPMLAIAKARALYARAKQIGGST